MFVVTGGGRGIGRALAQALASRGKSVLIVGRHESSLAEASADSPCIETICADVSTQAGREKIITRLHNVKSIDGLVHNAGIIEPIVPITDITESDWHQVMATNVDAPLFLTQQLTDKLQGGRVLNIGSGAAHFPVAGWTAYCVSKAALSMLTRCWQMESTNTAFASVMPGIIDTNMQAQIRDTQNMAPDKLEFFKQLKKDNQLLSPATVALFLCWLLLDIDATDYQSKEWDIYDYAHHQAWLIPPHQVPTWD